MDCPVGGEAAVQASNPCAENAGTLPLADEGVSAPQINGDYWRHEVASRLERYRARRKPRAPRYPSLRLPFDSGDNWVPVSGSALAVSTVAASPDPAIVDQGAPHLVETHPIHTEEPELFSNVIEFPRSAAVPVYHGNELAEPILERPRIVEAPEVLPPPPALGGILLEPDRAREPERRGPADLTLAPALLPQRVMAGLTDILILLAAVAAFGGMFVWVNPQRPPLLIIATAAASVGVILWAAYKFLFTVYTGTTPGLRLARLSLVKFDGSAPSRNRRRWRVLASYLSAVALGLGYLWSILDEDGLCWHDRITRTHLFLNTSD